jgi:methylmalonyl-CoA/ethylmalonyl-CoA epimerase
MKLHHVGVIVTDPEQLTAIADLFEIPLGEPYFVERYGAECHFSLPGGEGGTAIEFIVPREDSKLARFNKGAGGLHHLALEVDDIAAASESLSAKGVELLEQDPVDAGELRINFVPPAWTRGLLVELVERRVRRGG